MEVNTMNDYVYNSMIYINNWLVTYIFDNPITDNGIGAEGAKHLKLPGNLQTLNLVDK